MFVAGSVITLYFSAYEAFGGVNSHTSVQAHNVMGKQVPVGTNQSEALLQTILSIITLLIGQCRPEIASHHVIYGCTGINSSNRGMQML